MAVFTVNQLSRNGRVAVQNIALASTNVIAPTRFRAIGGTTLGTTGSTDVGFATFDVDDKTAFIVSWACSSAVSTGKQLLLTVAAGSDGRAWQNELGSYSFYPAGSATGSSGTYRGKRYIIGPFESARFARETTAGSTAARGTKAGNNHIQFTLSAASSESGNQARVNVLAFKMPGVSYST